jgi:hypothetical protein
MKTKNEFLKSKNCPVCGCICIVRRHEKLPASLMQALALASHVKNMHGITSK